MRITSEQREEIEPERRRVYQDGWESLVQQRKKPKGMKTRNKRGRIILMRFRKNKKRKSLSVWEHFICREVYREIINGE